MNRKSKWDYLFQLKLAIEDMYKCPACYLRTQLVDETVSGKTVWIGDVEVFTLTGHPKAKHCYAWKQRGGKTDQYEPFVAVLETGHVNSPQAAVHANVVADSKKSG